MGANGVLEVNDVKFISKHPDRTADVRLINNHGIYSIPLVTSNDVTVTASGELIIIMHQYAYHGKLKTCALLHR